MFRLNSSMSECIMQSKEQTRLVYENLARFYSIFRSRNGFAKIRRLLSLEDGMSLLDCGTGPGKYAYGLANAHPGVVVFGLDLCENFLRIVKRKAEAKGVDNLLLFGGDAECLPFGDGTFDRILCVQVLLLLQDKKSAVSEMYRVLKKGGLLLVVETRRRFLPWRELYYAFVLPVAMKLASLREPSMAKAKREDYGGRNFYHEELNALLGSVPFASVDIDVKATQMYAVCRK